MAHHQQGAIAGLAAVWTGQASVVRRTIGWTAVTGGVPVTAQPADPGLRQFAVDATRRAEEAEARLEKLLDVLEDTGITSGMSSEQLYQVLGVVGAEPRPGEKYLTTEEVRQRLGLPR
jgi:hypothetical protein